MKRILIIRMSALGDVAMLVPVVRQLVAEYPSLRVDVLSKPYTACLFAHLGEQVHFIGDMRKVDLTAYDMVADMHSVLRSHLLSLRLAVRGSRVRHIHKGRLGKRLLVLGLRRSQQMRTIDRYGDVLRRLGLPIHLPEPVIGEGERHHIGIAPFAAHRGKIYPLERMHEVVAALSRRMLSEMPEEQILLFGAGEMERQVLEQWAEEMPNVQSVVGKMKMDEEIDCMRTLRLMLTMDSGNMHLASLAGTRVISIWGATHADAGFLGWGQRREDCLERPLACRPCSVYGNKPCRYGDYRCMDIPVDEVVARMWKAMGD